MTNDDALAMLKAMVGVAGDPLRIITSEVRDDLKDFATLFVSRLLYHTPGEYEVALMIEREKWADPDRRAELLEQAHTGDRETRITILSVPPLPHVGIRKPSDLVILPVTNLEPHPVTEGVWRASSDHHCGAHVDGYPADLLRRLTEWQHETPDA